MSEIKLIPVIAIMKVSDKEKSEELNKLIGDMLLLDGRYKLAFISFEEVDNALSFTKLSEYIDEKMK